MHRLIKRGLVAAAAVAAVTPVAVLATQAGAQPTKGAEALNVTIYEVGMPPGNPTSSSGGGTASAGGVFAGKGNVADIPSSDPNATESTFAFPTGTFNFAVTGGRFSVASLNPVTCRFIANLTRAQGSIVSGTGVFASATGTFRVDASITGVLPHNPGVGCNTSETSEPILDTVQGHATGHINLH